MLKYVVRRLGYIIIVFLIISVVIFVVNKMIPGDPVTLMLDSSTAVTDPKRYEAMRENMIKQLGLDKPLYVQYFYWMANILRGDFGYSSEYRVPVIQIIAQPIGYTVMLNAISLVLVFAITIPLGIITAVKYRSRLDNIVQVGTAVGVSLPLFLISLLLIFVFASKLNWFPVSGVETAGFSGTRFEWVLDRVWHMALPLMALTISSLASITRYVKSAMIEALRQDYIRTARAKGLVEKVVIYSHAFRNALIPIVTIMTMWFIAIFGGSIAVEQIFSYNGIGLLLFRSLRHLDFAVVVCMNMFYALLTLIGNLAMDLIYGLVDPRVKLG